MDFHETAMIDTEEHEETTTPQSTRTGVVRVLTRDLIEYDSSVDKRVFMLEEYFSKL